jgi:HAD superfamily phosphatase (TIGR01668 family)
MKRLVPDFYLERFDEATADFLVTLGVRGIVLDVDNTLEPYENPLPTEPVKNWISSLKEQGISCAIVSNNNGERIKLFNSELNLPAFYKAKKPFKKNVLLALRLMGVEKENAILMGDQIFTDVLAARNAGLRAILVPPIKDKRDLFTRFKRLLERPIIKKYFKLKGK